MSNYQTYSAIQKMAQGVNCSWGNVQHNFGTIDFEEVITIVSSDLLRKEVLAIRSGGGNKILLPMFTPNGLFRKKSDPEKRSFSGRGMDDWQRGSGIIALDYDYIPNIEPYRAALPKSPYVLAFFVSPSGRGLKVFGRCPTLRSPESVPYVWRTFANLVDIKIPTGYKLPRKAGEGEPVNDKSAGVATQPLFMSWDPQAYYNTSAKEIPYPEYLPEWEPSPKLYSPPTINPDDIAAIIASRATGLAYTAGAKRRNRLVCPNCLYEGGSLKLYISRKGFWGVHCHFAQCGGIDWGDILDEMLALVPEYEHLAKTYEISPDGWT